MQQSKLAVIQGNWEEHFVQMQPYIGRTLDRSTCDRIATYAQQFLQARQPLFAHREGSGRIRDCHGDLRLQHVYLLESAPEAAAPVPLPRLAILDGIEFNERFRYGDVASEIAFLAMELDAAGRADLSRAFVDAYITCTGDDALREVLPFYCCYRACVRGKVLSFQLDEPEVPESQREAVRQQASALFELAASYTAGPTRPVLLMVGGLMGTGKSTLARALQRELGWTRFSSDAERKRLAHLDPAQPQAHAFGQGLYSPQWTTRTYKALQEKARSQLALGRSVLLDASFTRRADREAMMRQAGTLGASSVFVECRCPSAVALQRLAQRWQARTQGRRAASDAVSSASDGRPDLYDAQCRAYEEFGIEEEWGYQHLPIATERPLALALEQVLDGLHIPRFICRLPISHTTCSPSLARLSPPPPGSRSTVERAARVVLPPSYRRPARWPWIVLIVFLLFVLILVAPVILFGGLAYVGQSSTIETRDFPVTAHPTLILSNDTGSIHVRATSSDNTIVIQTTKHSSPWANADDLRVSYAHDQQANSVTVTVDRLNAMTFFTSASVDFDVTLPTSADLQLKTITGYIDVTGVSGQIGLTSNTGSLDVTNGILSGTSSLITNTGSVTFDGAIDRGGAYHFATNTGSVNVTLPAESAFHVEASTDTGSVNTTIAGILVRQNHGTGASASGDVGSLLRATMSLRTNTGSINLNQR